MYFFVISLFILLITGSSSPDTLFELYTDVEIVKTRYLNKRGKVLLEKEVDKHSVRECEFNNLSNLILWNQSLPKPFYIKVKKIQEMFEAYDDLIIEFVLSVDDTKLTVKLKDDTDNLWSLIYMDNEPYPIKKEFIKIEGGDKTVQTYFIGLKYNLQSLENSVKYCKTLLDINNDLIEIEKSIFSNGLLKSIGKEEIYLVNRNINPEDDVNISSPICKLYYSLINTRLSYLVPSLRVEKPPMETFSSFQNAYEGIVKTLINESRKYNSSVKQKDYLEMFEMKNVVFPFSSTFINCSEKIESLINLLKSVKVENKTNLIVTETDEIKKNKTLSFSKDLIPVLIECLGFFYVKYETCMKNFVYRKTVFVEERDFELTQSDLFVDLTIEFYLKWWEYNHLYDRENQEELEAFFGSIPFKSIVTTWIKNFLLREKSKLELLLSHPKTITGKYLNSPFLVDLVNRYDGCLKKLNLVCETHKDVIENNSCFIDKVQLPLACCVKKKVEKKN